MDVSNLPGRPKPLVKSAKKPIKQPKNDADARDDDSSIVQDPNFMFKTGFLAEVYKERPVSDQIPRIVTRMPPEPNVSSK
jgi:glutaminyl-tRNA synthetase